LEENVRERMVAALERTMVAMGAHSYEHGIAIALKLFRRLVEDLESIHTPDDLRKALDSLPAVSKMEGALNLFLMEHLPQVIRIGTMITAKTAAATLPAVTGGRPPAISENKRQEALDYVALLHRKGCTFEQAKERAALKFGCKKRTIERVWAERGSEQNSRVTMKEALAYLGINETGRL
jgi:hypothetical protein